MVGNKNGSSGESGIVDVEFRPGPGFDAKHTALLKVAACRRELRFAAESVECAANAQRAVERQIGRMAEKAELAVRAARGRVADLRLREITAIEEWERVSGGAPLPPDLGEGD